MTKSPSRDRGGGSGGGTHREDGDEDARSTQHRVVDGFHVLLRVPDAVVVAVEAPLVGLDCACLDDEERQPGYKEGETTTKSISNTKQVKTSSSQHPPTRFNQKTPFKPHITVPGAFLSVPLSFQREEHWDLLFQAGLAGKRHLLCYGYQMSAQPGSS